MTNLDVFEAKEDCNKWLTELTESEKYLIIEMLEEAREMGYNDGQKDAHSGFIDICNQFGFK